VRNRILRRKPWKRRVADEIMAGMRELERMMTWVRNLRRGSGLSIFHVARFANSRIQSVDAPDPEFV
jgi:hypothetical protein